MRWLFNIILLIAPSAVLAVDIEVRGRVLSHSNTPITGVNVLVMGSPNGTATDMDGYFTLSIPEGSAVLFFSYRKQKPLEHPIEVKRGYQYQVSVVLSGKTQSFNRSRAVTSELPLNAPKVIGTVYDQNNRELAGAKITQANSSFSTTTDLNGRFVLPMPSGESTLNVTFGLHKPLEYPLHLKQDSTYRLDVFLVEGVRKHRDQKSTATLVKGP